MKPQTGIGPASGIARLIRVIRDQRVILDSDLASVYEVPTKRLNEQYRLNLGRFPDDFAFRLTPEEWTALQSQIATPGTAGGMRSQNATSRSHSGRRHLPVAFTEHGALMAANILHSSRAVAMSVFRAKT